MSRQRADQPTTLPPPTMSVATLLILGLLGSLLGVVAAGDNVLSADVEILEAVQAVDLPGVERIVTISNAVFGTGGALVLAVVFIAAALLLHRPQFVMQLLVVVVLRLVGQLLKPVFDSPRPSVEYQPDPSLVSSSLGYPSGHAYTATVITTMLVLFVHSLGVPRWARWAAIAVAVTITGIALFARIRVGAHWPSDTFGGVLFGLATVALMRLIVRLIDRRPARRTATP